MISALGLASFSTRNPRDQARPPIASTGLIPSVFGPDHCGRYNYQNVVGAETWKRVVGYTFRTDSRSPDEVRAAGGFWAGYTVRDPDLTGPSDTARNGRAVSPFDVSAYLNEITSHGAFVSTSTSVDFVRRWYVKGWIYAIFVEGALDIVAMATGGTKLEEEREVAIPGGADWNDVVAYRDSAGSGPIFMRDGFDVVDAAAASEILRRLAW